MTWWEKMSRQEWEFGFLGSLRGFDQSEEGARSEEVMWIIIVLVAGTVTWAAGYPTSGGHNYTNSPVGGPNVCGDRGQRTFCCQGWLLDHRSGLCIRPICNVKCGRGRCVKPNRCLCEDGTLAYTCPPHKSQPTQPPHRHKNVVESTQKRPEDGCRYPCLNGGRCIGTKCSCKLGYEGESCSQPVCKEPCMNGGRCISPDTCACLYGYTGKRCEADYRTGPCYTKIEDGQCIAQLPGVVCTRNLCCATVGKAWGHPCEMCPHNLPCDEGFLKNIHTGQCVDINECEAIPGLCLGGKCVNTVGSFKCECPKGQSREAESNICRDVDECSLNDGLCENGRCVNTEGSYYCQCSPGFISDSTHTGCIDARQDYCYTSVERGQCVNSLSMRLSKRDCCCGMNMGAAWGRDCQFCPIQGEKSYESLCGSANGGGGPEVDECGLRPGICGGGDCVDAAHGYSCVCHPGYEKTVSEVCEDVDECLLGFCSGGACYNSPGSFQCTCPLGFDVSSDGRRCIDHDECSQNGMCANGMCINMEGSFKCRCKDGFVPSSTGHSCVDTDECLENPMICLNGRCENTPGSYRCTCQDGFVLSKDGAFCRDMDECAGGGTCANGRCINTDGSFKCLCDAGFRVSPDGKRCVDIDECSGQHPPCQNGICHNTPGSFTCDCRFGFSLGPDGRSCIDSRKELCYSSVKNGQCTNPSSVPVSESSCCCCVSFPGQPMGWGPSCRICPLPGTQEFHKLCPHGPGMTNAGTDINECSQNQNICQNGACENLMGTHRCVCDPGYEEDSTGKACVDVDECRSDDFLCHGGQCRNTPGSFQCICPAGTRVNMENGACEDIDECSEQGPDACFNGLCHNTFGSYSCDCPVGSILDHTGRACIDNHKGTCWTRIVGGKCESNLPQLTLKAECCCSVGLAWGSPCEPCHHKDCDCPRGYSKRDGKVCKDINECELNAGVCRGGGTCVNTEGSFTCICPPGLTLDSTGTVCVDTRQESCFTQLKHGQGKGVIDGLFPRALCCCSGVGKAWGGPSTGDSCQACPKPNTSNFNDLCPKGKGFVDKKDINECLEFPGMCRNGRCKNMMGGFACRCNQGYALDDYEISCIDIDECEIMHGVCGNGTCQNMPGSFSCECKEGYESTAMMKVCMDINECERQPGLCKGGICVNTPGSFKCDCPPGHELSADRTFCKDIDECSRTSGICSNGVCENMMGTYQCVCEDGYDHAAAGVTSHCQDIDECNETNGGCSSLCLNTAGSYSCACHDGYVLKKDGRGCEDIDECKENPRICLGGKCMNTIGSFKCECTKGLLPGADGSSCVDINECEDHSNICGNGDCDNTIGSFRCHCEPGYSAKPTGDPHCTDDDECELMMHNCDINAHCTNHPGSFSCHCREGFVGDGVVCHDINECLTDNGGCSEQAKCRNTEGSFECSCDEGFKGDGRICTDVDECAENPLLCHNGHCLNHPGNYRCECEMGFMHPDSTESSCVDINECTVFNNVCVFGTCENVFGLFKCICDEGFQLDNTGGNCTDINECDNPLACRYGTCQNTVGSYICQCPPNYQLVPAKNACVDKRESRCYLEVDEERRSCTKETGHLGTKASCCCSLGKGWGSRCEICPKPGTLEYADLCPGGRGYRPNPTTVVIEDINECEDHENICKNGHCTNTFGSFMCSCHEGYRLNSAKASCEDIDECSETNGICGFGFCMNDLGTYHCICPDGYMLLPNGKKCIDMRKDKCYMHFENGQCEVPMSNSQTKMVCCCSMGEAWGQPCAPCPTPRTKEYIELCGTQPGQIVNPMTNLTEEIDECTLMPTMCNHGECMNTPGSFECQCNSGFSYDVDAHQCVDENECLRSPSPCRGNAVCINTQGSFLCQCPDGYKLGVSLRDCVDVDECTERYNVCEHGNCANFQGSFQCTCDTGYTLTPNRATCVDVDECSRHPNICNNGTCSNKDGSYSCHCHPGFKLSHNNDCIDIDECHSMIFLCRNGRCRNTIGSFKCECAEGYSLSPDGDQCRDIDECSEMRGICLFGNCQNTMGSFLCTCPPGYHLSPNKRECLDINECYERRGICEGGTCMNTNGGVICECPVGFELSDSGLKCIDVRQDYCYEQLEQGRCTKPRMEPLTMKECCCSMGMAWGTWCEHCPIEGSDEFLKLCPQGIGRYDTGADLNECEFMPDICSGGDCINTDGSFRCVCPPGYVLDSSGKNCIDEDECLKSDSICGNGTCTNMEGSFECNCGPGFAPGPMQVCEDVDECQELSSQCAFKCHNTPGSFRCICPYGYTLAPDGRHCQDVDECSTPANKCKFDCKNLIGSFMCICPEGYKKVGDTDECEDVDECSLSPGVCTNGNCINLEGAYICDCFPGYKPNFDSTKCIDGREGYCYRQLLPSGKCSMHSDGHKVVSKADCCCTMGAAWGPDCERCPGPGSTSYTELCLESGITINGQDINECETMHDLCKHGTCINTLGSYKCLCHKGFKVDQSGTICQDVNECDGGRGPCQHSCQNTIGSFVCTCPRGFQRSLDGLSCTDIDECTAGTHICQQTCINTIGSYTCSCASGFTQDGDYCLDVDECKRDGICPSPGRCVNTLGSFRCLCPRGFKLDETGKYCRDMDECTNDSKCKHGCQNILGSYRCGCPDGMLKHIYYNQCIDEDECKAGRPCGDLPCFNTIGSYTCGCPTGFKFDRSTVSCVKMQRECMASTCSYGCSPAPSQRGFSCDCPPGYQPVAQGHCFSAVGVEMSSLSTVGSSHMEPNPYRIGTDKIISTEGCFACKTNGRKRRMTNGTLHRHRHLKHRVRVLRTKRVSETAKNVTTVKIHLKQTKHRMRIIKLVPSEGPDTMYTITKGDPNNLLDVDRGIDGIWGVHFRRRLKSPSNFHLEITATSPTSEDIIRIRLIVLK